MTAVSPGSEQLFFHSKEEIVDHLLIKVLANKNRLLGTEVEMFFIDRSGHPITRENGQKLFRELHRNLSAKNHKVALKFEDVRGEDKIIALSANGYGDVNLEAGHQLEFACSPSRTTSEIAKKNADMYAVIREVAKKIDHEVVFSGHWPGYAQLTEGVYRSRGRRWREYYDNRFGDNAFSLREAQDGTASTQITIDSGAEKFHEFFKALLILEPVLAIAYGNSDRASVIRNYGDDIPSQVKPLTTVWEAKDPREAIVIIVDRLMQIEVPFLPDPDRPGIYKAEPLDAKKYPPTVERLMQLGRLNERVLNNVGGFFYTWPAFRNFDKALLEIRGVDSLGSPGDVTRVAQFVNEIIYDDGVRQKLLADYSSLRTADIEKLHLAASMREKQFARAVVIPNYGYVSSIIDDVLHRGASSGNVYRRSLRRNGSKGPLSSDTMDVAPPLAAQSHHKIPAVSLLGQTEPHRPARDHQRPGSDVRWQSLVA